ncbi:hypothetical protein PVK06_001918 [Gossypium arboreum]|uniref:Protein kinase domain-containing protein n=1 Tax=Gossypium arboreum TaxID=29729 RepID=A0ABR0R3L6_GOSAR|nr:hypothetical protein PVK06_001918 [Gossypium arboreum]
MILKIWSWKLRSGISKCKRKLKAAQNDVPITENEANILGKGGFGIVYKGVLHDGTQIAVKRMECVGKGTKGMAEFQAEIAVLSKVRHLVALLGYCINGNERLLVYEYMPRGTLCIRVKHQDLIHIIQGYICSARVA